MTEAGLELPVRTLHYALLPACKNCATTSHPQIPYLRVKLNNKKDEGWNLHKEDSKKEGRRQVREEAIWKRDIIEEGNLKNKDLSTTLK